MSAIAGVVCDAYDHSAVNAMLESMTRRGRGEKDLSKIDNCLLMHTGRTGNSQPLTLETEEDTITFVFSGALYNKEELMTDLHRAGYYPPTRTDASIALYCYQQWGEHCLCKFNGVFTLAAWHSKQKQLFIARDRIGVKPLFYYLQDDSFLFASEIKTLLRHPMVKPILDEEGISQIILLGPGRIPGSGVLRNICELEPGTYGVYRQCQLHKKRYWVLTDREHTQDFENTAMYVRWLVKDAIKRQSKTDLPAGCLLSGGLDSSIISTVCAELFAQDGKQLQTYSLDFDNNDKYFTPGKFQPESDNKYIELMVSAIRSNHKLISLSADELVAYQDDAVQARDLPGMADVDTSLLLFCREISKDVDVILSGECADEIFGGYPWYRDPDICAAEGFPWSQNINQRAGLLYPDTVNKIRPKDFVMDHYRKTIDACDILPGTSRKERRMKEMMQLNLWWFMQTLIDRKDRMSMYSGLEPRVPFCDYRIVEYLYAVPWDFKDYMNREKGLLRYAMDGILPSAISKRKKSPYPKTYDPRYLELVSKRLQDLIAKKDAPLFQIVDPRAVTQLLESDFSFPWYGQLMRLPQTIAYMLQINTWMETYHIQVQ